MLAVGILALPSRRRLARAADVVAAMTVEAALGTDAPFDERLQRLRPHPGQNASASNLRRLLAGSPILASHRDSPAPGAGRVFAALRPPGARRHPRRARLRHRGAADRGGQRQRQPDRAARPGRGDDEVRAGGNFHGQPVAVALDTLATGARSRWPRSANAASTALLDPEAEQRPARRSWSTGAG